MQPILLVCWSGLTSANWAQPRWGMSAADISSSLLTHPSPLLTASPTARAHINIKTFFPMLKIRQSVPRPSYLYHGDPVLVRQHVYIETTPWIPICHSDSNPRTSSWDNQSDPSVDPSGGNITDKSPWVCEFRHQGHLWRINPHNIWAAEDQLYSVASIAGASPDEIKQILETCNIAMLLCWIQLLRFVRTCH